MTTELQIGNMVMHDDGINHFRGVITELNDNLSFANGMVKRCRDGALCPVYTNNLTRIIQKEDASIVVLTKKGHYINRLTEYLALGELMHGNKRIAYVQWC